MEFRHYGNRALFLGFGAFSALLGSTVPAGALSLTQPPPRMVCVANNGSYIRPVAIGVKCKKGETLIRFDELVAGPRGATGPRAPAGPAGPMGTGATGPAGPAGVPGP